MEEIAKRVLISVAQTTLKTLRETPTAWELQQLGAEITGMTNELVSFDVKTHFIPLPKTVKSELRLCGALRLVLLP